MSARFAALLCCLLLLTGCGTRTVAVIDDKGFAEMSRRMPEEMRARKLLTQEGDYYSRPAAARPYGDILFATLSPDFLFDDTGGHVYLGETFRATRTPSSRVSLRENGFTLRHPTQIVTVAMLGELDWDDNGSDEWLVSCRVEPLRGSRVRTYYLLRPPRTRASPSRPAWPRCTNATGWPAPCMSITRSSCAARATTAASPPPRCRIPSRACNRSPNRQQPERTPPRPADWKSTAFRDKHHLLLVWGGRGPLPRRGRWQIRCRCLLGDEEALQASAAEQRGLPPSKNVMGPEPKKA